MRDAFQSLSPDKDYRYWFDPFWVRAEPYRISLSSGESREISLHLRNFRPGKQKHHIEIHPPPRLVAEPPVWEGHLAAESRGTFKFRLRAEPNLKPGVRIVAFDVTLDGHRYGEWFDLNSNIDVDAL